MANILSSELMDVKHYQKARLKALLINCDDLEDSEDESDDLTELIDANPKLFKKIVRRRSVIENSNKQIQQKVFRKNSVTAALEHIVPPTVSSAGWDYTHLLVLSTTSRFSFSRGLLRHLLSCLISFNETYFPPSVTLLNDCPTSFPSPDTSYQLVKPLYEYVSSTPIHPAAITVVNAIGQLYKLLLSRISKNHHDQGKNALTALISSFSDMFTFTGEISLDSPQCASLISEIHSVFEEVISKCEGNYRVNLLSQMYSSILCNSCETEMPLMPNSEITSAAEYLHLQFPHPLYPNKVLNPSCDKRWVEFILSQEKSVNLILNQRKISVQSEQVAADIARSNPIILALTFFRGEYDLQERRRISMIEESALPQISSLILNIPNHNLRLSSEDVSRLTTIP